MPGAIYPSILIRTAHHHSVSVNQNRLTGNPDPIRMTQNCKHTKAKQKCCPHGNSCSPCAWSDFPRITFLQKIICLRSDVNSIILIKGNIHRFITVFSTLYIIACRNNILYIPLQPRCQFQIITGISSIISRQFINRRHTHIAMQRNVVTRIINPL